MRIKVGIIGAGNMGSAIIAGMSKNFDVYVCEADKKKAAVIQKKYGASVVDLKVLLKKSKAIILAVKPQGMDPLLEDIKQVGFDKQLFVSIAAGLKTSYFEKKLGRNVRVIRTMPNLPALVGEAVSGISVGKYARSMDTILACQILNSVGKTVVVSESQMDAITAVSGSGPAYVFYFIECLMKAAKSLGLKADVAHDLVIETLKGSVSLLENQKVDASVLRERVTSKGGTTQAALNVLTKSKVDQIFKEALKAAKNRSKELSK